MWHIMVVLIKKLEVISSNYFSFKLNYLIFQANNFIQ